MLAFPTKIVHFATWKCFISGPIIIVLVYKHDKYMIWGLHGSLRKKILQLMS